MKQYKSVDLDLRWHPSTRSITLNGKLKESINEKLIHLALVTGQLNNKDTEHAATDKYCMNEPELSDCNCAHLNADMEGIKLDMTILESRMLAAMSKNEHESDIISLRVKLVDMEAVVHNQDEIISRLSEENLSFRSRLMNLEKSVHFMSQEYRNKSSGAINLSNITKEPSTRNRKQSINLNKNSLSSPQNTDNNLSHDNQQYVSPSVSNIDFTADVPQPNSQTKQKVDLTADDRMADESQPNPLIKQKVDLTADEPLPNPLIAQNKEINLPKNGNSYSKTKFNRVSNEDKNNKYVNSPKSSIPCPFLSRRGWCAKGNRCDFQHKEPGRDKHKISCPFLRRNGFCLKGDRCDYSHIGFSHGMVAPRPRMNATAYPSSSLHTSIYQCAPPFQPDTRHNTRSPFLSHSPWPMIPPPPPPSPTDECSYLAPADILNIHDHKPMTSPSYQENLHNITVRITNRSFNKSYKIPSRTHGNLITVSSKTQNENKKTFVPKIFLTNTMSLTPKIDEVSCFMKIHNPDAACITETWLHGSIDESCLYIDGYNFIFKNRSVGCHGGVGLYIKNSISFECLDHLQHPLLEVLWVRLTPKRLPRGFTCLVIGVIYHLPRADDHEMLSYLSISLTTIESDYPGCGLMLSGDFNQLKVNRLLNQFQCKQMVNVSTRADKTLDLIITNLYSFYAKDSVEKHPPFGLSDHNVVILNPKNRCDKSDSRKVVISRDMRPSKKSELGRYLTSCNWSILNHLETCEEKLELFTDLINLGINILMPKRRITLHVNDPPWITANFKILIKKRQAAFSNGNNELFRYITATELIVKEKNAVKSFIR